MDVKGHNNYLYEIYPLQFSPIILDKKGSGDAKNEEGYKI